MADKVRPLSGQLTPQRVKGIPRPAPIRFEAEAVRVEGTKQTALILKNKAPALPKDLKPIITALRELDDREAVTLTDMNECLDVVAAKGSKDGAAIRAVKCRHTEAAVPLRVSPNGLVQTAVRTNANDRIELYGVRLKNGNVRWRSETITKFDANRSSFAPEWQTVPEADPAMTLRKNDMIVITDDGEDRLMFVRKFDRNGNILLVEHFESRSDKAAKKQDPDAHRAHFKIVRAEGLRKLNARRVHVTPGGRVFAENQPVISDGRAL